MNDSNAATATALTTVEEALSATGRADVLNEFARMALGQAPLEADAKGNEASPDEAQAEPVTDDVAKQDDLSQSKAEEQGEDAEAKADDESPVEEGTPESEDELPAKLDEHTQKAVNKRIAREVAKTKAEREKADTLQAQITELQQQLEQKQQGETPQVVRSPNNPLAHVNTPQALEAEALRAEQAQDQAEEMLETLQDLPEQVEAALRTAKVELKDDLGQEDYSVGRMRQFLRGVKRNAHSVLKQAVPERRAYLEQANVAFAKAQEIVPELKDTKSPRALRFQQVVQAYPDLKSQPWWPVAAAVQLIGLETLEKQMAAAKPVAAKAKPPLPVTIPSPKATAPTPRTKSGGVSDDTVQAAIGGDKAARMKVIQSLVPKFA